MSDPDKGACLAGPKQAAAAVDKEATAGGRGCWASGKHQSQAGPYQPPSSQGWLLSGGHRWVPATCESGLGMRSSSL